MYSFMGLLKILWLHILYKHTIQCDLGNAWATERISHLEDEPFPSNSLD